MPAVLVIGVQCCCYGYLLLSPGLSLGFQVNSPHIEAFLFSYWDREKQKGIKEDPYSTDPPLTKLFQNSIPTHMPRTSTLCASTWLLSLRSLTSPIIPHFIKKELYNDQLTVCKTSHSSFRNYSLNKTNHYDICRFWLCWIHVSVIKRRTWILLWFRKTDYPPYFVLDVSNRCC